MAAFATWSRGTRVAVLLLGGAAAAGVGYLGWQMTRATAPATAPSAAVATAPASPADATSAEPAPVVAPAAETATAAKPAADAPADPTVDPTADPAAEPAKPVMPVIDTWRVTAEGEAVVSGSAAPGAKVEIIVDGTAVATGEATVSGEFAILFTLPPNAKPSLMWLSTVMPDQPAIASEEMVALGPIAGPKLAAADMESAPADAEVAAAVDPAAPAALLLSAEGAVVLQAPATPDPVAVDTASVMIDTIAYTPEGEVQVGGRGAAGAGLRLYLDNAEKMTLQVPATGLWAATLTDTAPGVYTLRVDQLDAAGKVTSRFETPFKRETLEALAAAAGTAQDPEPAAQATAAVPDATAPRQEAKPVQPADSAAAPAAEPTVEPTVETATAEPQPVMPAPPVDGGAEAPDAPAVAQADPAPLAPAASAPVTVTVQPGFTLWGIAQERMGDGVLYVQVFEANKDKIKDPDLIYPGQIFSMPEPAAP